MDLVPLQVSRRLSLCEDRAYSRDWAIVVPSYLMLVVWLAYLGYAALGAFLTPSFDSPSLITGKCLGTRPDCDIAYGADGYSSIPAPSNGDLYYWKFTDPDIIPEAIDLPIDLVNRVLYPPRPRPRPRRRRSGSSA
jgi:phosphatidylinositol glycan class P protein